MICYPGCRGISCAVSCMFRLSLKKLPEAFSGGIGLRPKKAPRYTREKSSGTKGNYLCFLIQKRDRSQVVLLVPKKKNPHSLILSFRRQAQKKAVSSSHHYQQSQIGYESPCIPQSLEDPRNRLYSKQYSQVIFSNKLAGNLSLKQLFLFVIPVDTLAQDCLQSPIIFCKISKIEDLTLRAAILVEFQIHRPLGTYETKMAARTGKRQILTILRNNKGL